MQRSFDTARAGSRFADDRPRAEPSTGGLDETHTLVASGHAGHLIDALVELQRTAGNRRVQQVVADLRSSATRPPVIQPKLVLGHPDDRHEREADRIARIVGDSGARLAQPGVARPMAAVDGGPVSEGVRSAIDRGRGGGQPVPDETRRSLERTLGADFTAVRLHTDGRAHELNHALQSRAFTVGHDIYFRRGDYDPGSARGRRLLAHELTHVVQQGGAGRHPSRSPHGQVIQRELTDEARKVLEDANKRAEFVTVVKGGHDALDYLDTNDAVRPHHVQEIMRLPEGAPPALKNLVQTGLLKAFAYLLITKLPTDRKPTPEDVQKYVTAMEETKQDLLLAGYGETSEVTQDLFSVIRQMFGTDTPWVLEAYGIKPPAEDPRKLELCATYVPGSDNKLLGRSHSFILYTSPTGVMGYVSVHANEQGILEAAYGIWSPSIFGDKDFTRRTVAVGAAAEAAFKPMTAGADKINAAVLPYNMLWRNCNTAAHYLLEEAGIERESGANIKTTLFGWSGSLGKDIEKKQPKEKVEKEKTREKAKASKGEKKKAFSFWPFPTAPGSSSSASTTASSSSNSSMSSSSTSTATVRPRARYGGMESAGLRRYYPAAQLPASSPTSTAGPAPTTSSSTSTSSTSSTASATPRPVVAPTGIVVTVTFPLTIGTAVVKADSNVVVLGTNPTTGMVEVASLTGEVRGFVDADVLRESTTWYWFT